MTELERQLTRLGQDLDWPPTPDVSSRIRQRLQPARRRPVLFRRAVAIAIASLLVLAAGVVAAVPSARDSVLEFFGLQGATIERREELPALPEARPLQLGKRTTLTEARGSLGFDPLVPRGLGRPDGVFTNENVPGGELSLAYRPRAGLPEARSTGLGLLVNEFRGDIAPEYVGKAVSPATDVRELVIDGERALWVEGAPHFFIYRPEGEVFTEHALRIAQNVLLLEHGKLLVRLEGAFGQAKAVELARSLR